MENDGNLSDADLIYVGEEHIDLEGSVHSSGADEILVEQDQFCGNSEISYGYIVNEGEDSYYRNEGRDEKDLSSGKVEGLMIVDEWDDEDIDSDDEKEDLFKKEKDAMNPEDIEKAMLSMPTMKTLMDDIGHLKQRRKLIAYPLTLEDFNAPQIQDILTWSALEEAKLDYTRNHKDPKFMLGVLVLHFTTSGSANKAMGAIKAWRNDLKVTCETNTNKMVEDFISDLRGKKRWTDNVAILKNLADDIEAESVKELFPQAEEVVLRLESSKHKETDSTNSKDASSIVTSMPTPKGYAYLIFPSDDIVNTEVTEAAAKKLELKGHRLLLLNYRNPVNTVPRAYLRLRERKVILRHLDKCAKIFDKANIDPSVKLPDKMEERVELCKSLIEKDNKCRKEMELPEPSLGELRRMPGLPALDAASCQKILVRFGIIKERKRRSVTPQNDKHRERNSNRSSSRGTFKKVSPNRTGRSPYSDHRKPRGSNYRRSGNTGSLNNRPIPPPLLGSTSSIVNPLAFMMQQNLGMLGGGAVLNPNLIPPNIPLMGGGNAMLASSLPIVTGGLENGKSKMLRLDESGNYREADDFGHGSSHYNDRMRRNDADSRSTARRKRSISPMSRSRQYDMLDNKRSNLDDGIPTPVNLLLNLSQMLSNGMEPQRVEKGRRPPYNRAYQGNRR